MPNMKRFFSLFFAVLLMASLLAVNCYAATLSKPTLNTPSISGNTITVSWKNVDGANRYYVYYGTSSSITNSKTNVVSVDNVSSYMVKNLEYSTTYYFWVKAANSSSVSSASTRKSAKTEKPPVPAKPKLNTPIVSGNSIILNWTKVSGATGYELFYGTSSSISKASKIQLGNVSSKKLSGLSYSKTYYFWLKAKNSYGISSASARVSAKIGSEPTKLKPPTQQTPNVKNNTLTVSWSKVSDATSYIVYLSTSSSISSSGTMSVKVGNVSSATLNGLDYDTIYYTWVKSVNSSLGLTSDASSRKSAKTARGTVSSITFDSCGFVASSRKPTSSVQGGPLYDQTDYPLKAGNTIEIPFITDAAAKKVTVQLRTAVGNSWVTYTDTSGNPITATTTSFKMSGSKKTGMVRLKIPKDIPIGAYMFELYAKNSTDSDGKWISARAKVFVSSTYYNKLSVEIQEGNSHKNGAGYTVAGVGCGPASVVNAIRYMTGGSAPEMDECFDWAYGNGSCISGSVYGYSESKNIYKLAGQKYGKDYGFQWVDTLSNLSWSNGQTKLKEYLRKGYVAVAIFTRDSGCSHKSASGHFIVIASYNPDTDKYLLMDSAPTLWSKGASGWSWQSIDSSTRRLGNHSCVRIGSSSTINIFAPNIQTKNIVP